MKIDFERFVSRGISRWLSNEMDLAGVKTTVNKMLGIIIIGFLGVFIIASFALRLLNYGILIYAAGSVAASVFYLVGIYMYLEFLIDKRKTMVDQMLPDFFQIVSANLRSGISLDRSLVIAARKEFTILAEEVSSMNRRVMSGETLERALVEFSMRFRSYQLQHAVKMMNEAIRYGGAMADLLDQISKDLRNQNMIQKEISGQLFMYTIFIAFASLIAAPFLYGLTTQMINITAGVWQSILKSSPGGLPSTGISLLRPSPPKIAPSTYNTFSIIAIIIITGFAALIMSTISSGSALKGLRLMPVFIIIGISIFIVVQHVMGAFFAHIAG